MTEEQKQQYIELLNQKLAEFNTSAKELFTGKFSWKELTTFLKAGVEVAESLFNYSGAGSKKSEIVMSMWDHYDQEFNLVEKLDEMIDLKKFFGTFVGSMLETIDSKAIRGVIEYIVIPSIVKVVFP